MQGGYLTALAAELKDESKPFDTRQLAGVLIKNELDANVSAVGSKQPACSCWRSSDRPVDATGAAATGQHKRHHQHQQHHATGTPLEAIGCAARLHGLPPPQNPVVLEAKQSAWVALPVEHKNAIKIEVRPPTHWHALPRWHLW